MSPNQLDRFGGIGVAWAYMLGSTCLYLLLAWFVALLLMNRRSMREADRRGVILEAPEVQERLD